MDKLFDFSAFVPLAGDTIKVLESNYDLRGTLFTFSGTYGLTEHWDVGFVAPYVKLIGEGDWAFWFGQAVADFHDSSRLDSYFFTLFLFVLFTLGKQSG